MPWPLSEATPALFSCSHPNLVFFHSPSFVDVALLAVSPSSNLLTSLAFRRAPVTSAPPVLAGRRFLRRG